ncbi:hypothetical protein PQZ42_02765 [Alphaproteobacteria bacterium]|nr:hypothetical protein [Alphaproteobacteria bacterium]
MLIFTGYLFYKSYAIQETKLKNIKLEEQAIFSDLIKNNSNQIEKLNLIIDNLNNSILKISENIQVYKTPNNKIGEEEELLFSELREEISSLSAKVQKNTEINVNTKLKIAKNNIKKNNINEIINIIKLKFEDGKKFSYELDILSDISKEEIIPVLEKMYVLNNANFKGGEKLLLEFQNETNKYISNVIISKNNPIKYLLSFIEIQPSVKNNLNSEVLISLKKINDFIIKREYEKSYIIIKSLENYNEYFNKTSEQLDIGKSFYKALEGISISG